MLLRVPAGTLKELVEYAKMLDRRKVGYQAVVTKVAFDHTVAHQKFTFKAVRFVTPDEAEAIRDQLESPVIQQILGLAPVSHESHDDGLGDTPEHVRQPTPVKAVAPPAPKPTPKLRPVKTVSTVIPEEVEEAVAVAKPKPKAAPAPAPAPANKKVDHSALLAEANASLDDVLSAIDD
jgi:outer membrane biosynthesis protein TonB